MTSRLKAYFDDYASFHQTRGNQLTHYFGIPFIVISLLGLLSTLTLGSPALFASNSLLRMDGGILLILIVIPFYNYLDWKIALPFTFILLGLYFLGRALPVPLCWTLFIFGWILQGIRHAVYEKKSPAFMKNLSHLLIGPLWIFSKLIRYQPQ